MNSIDMCIYLYFERCLHDYPCDHRSTSSKCIVDSTHYINVIIHHILLAFKGQCKGAFYIMVYVQETWGGFKVQNMDYKSVFATSC